jgi:diadenosine tetraphosphate (Ap4A) HIT family hydrolase
MFMKECSHLYERIATREIPSRLVYENLEHGLMVLLDPMPVAKGHLTVATLACAKSIDAIKSPVLHNKVSTAAKFAGRVLSVVFPDAPYIGELTASNQVRHPHLHRVPGDEKAEWVKRFSKEDAWPRLKFADNVMDDLQGQLSAEGAIQELWEECDSEVTAIGAPDEATVNAIAQLEIVLP